MYKCIKEEQEAKRNNTELVIDFNSKTPASITLTYNTTIFNISQIPYKLQNT